MKKRNKMNKLKTYLKDRKYWVISIKQVFLILADFFSKYYTEKNHNWINSVSKPYLRSSELVCEKCTENTRKAQKIMNLFMMSSNFLSAPSNLICDDLLTIHKWIVTNRNNSQLNYFFFQVLHRSINYYWFRIFTMQFQISTSQILRSYICELGTIVLNESSEVNDCFWLFSDFSCVIDFGLDFTNYPDRILLFGSISLM